MTTKPESTVAISASFTAEPTSESLRFWLDTLDLNLGIEYSAYNQVFQTILDPFGLFAKNVGGVNVILLRWHDLGDSTQVEDNATSLISTIAGAGAQMRAPLIVVACPPSDEVLADSARAALARRLDAALSTAVASVSNVHLLSGASIAEQYGVATVNDPVSDRLGQVPYTAEFFAALGTAIARRVATLRRAPYKVIAVDLDNTMWGGVVGEEGAAGVQIGAPHLALQRFLLEQRDNGMLLAIASKNNEADAWEVFDRRPEMLLKREHFATWRIDWESKASNLRAMAQELSLGIESFIFVDDDRKECAEVEARVPEAVTLRLPENTADTERFLRNVWAFDRATVTAEDRARSASYQQERARTAAVESAASLEDFIEKLDLQVTIAPLQSALLPRVAQLTQRTNQFNTTTVRRTEAELRAQLDGGLECITIAVTDRFGDYGNVGAVLYRVEPAALTVESFMLSCRALGRGVEHQIVRHLGQEAVRRGSAEVRIPFIPTAKNAPAARFLGSIDAAHDAGEESESYVLDAPVASALAYRPVSYADVVKSEKGEVAPPATAHPSPVRYADLAHQYHSARAVLDALRPARTAQSSADSGDARVVEAPRDDIERSLTTIWADVLQVPNVGIRDSFFDLGGDSLKAVELMMRVVQKFGANELTLSAILGAPSVAEFAELLRDASRPRVRCLVPIRESGTHLPFFCVPGAGGNVLSLRPMALNLPADVPVWCLQAPGLDGSSTIDNVPQIASLYIDEIRTVQPEGPYFLGGACYGGQIALEMAQQLTARGEKVALLAMLDSYNIAYGQMIPRLRTIYYHVRFFGQRLGSHTRTLVRLPLSEWPAYLSDKGRAMLKHVERFRKALANALVSTPEMPDVVIPAELRGESGTQQSEAFDVLERVKNATITAVESYVPRQYPGRITVFTAITGFVEPYQDKYLGWEPIAAGGVDMEWVEGDHNSIFDNGRHLADALGAHMAIEDPKEALRSPSTTGSSTPFAARS